MISSLNKNLLYGLSARLFYGLNEASQKAAKRMLKKIEEEVKAQGVDPMEYELLPLVDIFSNENGKAIIEANEYGTKTDRNKAVEKVTKLLKRYVAERKWGDKKLIILADTYKFSSYGLDDSYLCIGFDVLDSNKARDRVNSWAELDRHLRKFFENNPNIFADIWVEILVPNPDDF